jgi:hypothetical protein
LLEEFRVSVKISGSVNQVWEKLVDWKSQGDWMALTKVTSSVDDGGPSGVGTEISAFTGIGRLGVIDLMRVTEWSPPNFCAVDHFGPIIKGIGEFRLTQVTATEVRFDWYEKITAPKIVLAIIKPGVIIAVTYSLKKFARSFTSTR